MLDLAPIKARMERATAGPWNAVCDSTRPDVYTTEREGGYFNEGHLFAMDKYDGNADDAEFSACARTDVPNLVAEVERLRAELAGIPAEGHIPPADPVDKIDTARELQRMAESEYEDMKEADRGWAAAVRRQGKS